MNKQLVLTLLLIFLAIPTQAIEHQEAEESDEHVLTPEQEAEYFQDTFYRELYNFDKSVHRFKFPQTNWLECSDKITGNFSGYGCSNKRNISVILKTYLMNHFTSCVNDALRAQGGGTTDDIHIIHNGILGDPRHSPRSLHAENRAIDVKSIEMKLKSGATKSFVYEKKSNRDFYIALRKCWGKTVSTKNNCPIYNGSSMLTASIGWEDSRHQHHLHMSVPYCVGGSYSSKYYRK